MLGKKKLLAVLVGLWLLGLGLTPQKASFAAGPAGYQTVPGPAPRLKTDTEGQVAEVVEEVYRLYLREVTLSGKKLLIRIPFGQYGERYAGQAIFGGGKAAPWDIWPKIERILESEDFKQYLETLDQPGEKLVLLDVPRRKVEIIIDEKRREMAKARFLGSKLYPCEIKEEAGFSEIDIYNYLYAKGIGVDCSGFSFFVLRYIAHQYGINLYRAIGIGPLYIGNWIYHPGNVDVVDDRIINLRPGDVVLFHCWNRPNCHSLVLGEIDFAKGEITYYQCTDWVADRSQRGPHRAKIFFDPAFPNRRLTDPEVVWEKEVGEAFPEEDCPYRGRTDDYRYSIRGQGRIVRLKILANLLREKEPLYFK
ncbi:hypothetical protein L6258_00480 [Candidatus Parcubacteria bacterium]|nr:hypothetical protein [Candidatus Parcubacteria bacterium]